MKTELLSIGQNSKLGKKIGIFNLPAKITCPKATPICSKICYAQKAERCYKTAREKRARNLKAITSSDFVTKFVNEITNNNLTQIRFHESGDVINQEYLNKIFEICNKCPNVQFLQYSKCSHLNWTNKPKNLSLYYSIDNSTNLKDIPLNWKQAYTVIKGEKIPKGYKTCIHKKNEHYCGDECKICWIGKNNVYFLQH